MLYYLVHSMSAGKGFEQTDRRAAETVAKAAAAASVGRIVYLGGLHPDDVALSPHLRSRVEVGEVFLELGRADARAAGRRGDRIGLGVVRDGAAPHRRPAVHAGAAVGAQSHPADRGARRAVLPARSRTDRARRQPRRRHRRTRRAAVRADDERLRGRGRPAAAADRGAAGADAPARIPLGEPRDADPAVDRPTARRVAAERVRHEGSRHRRPHPAAGGRTHALSARRSRWLSDAFTTTRSRRAGWMPRCSACRATRCRAIRTGPARPCSSTPGPPSRPRPPAQLWRVIEGIGGENGWYSSPLLWAIRGWMDRLVGGIGLARGRRSRARLEVGDALDFWRVEAIERGSFLRLRAEMKVPGLAWLELRASRKATARATTSGRCSSRRASPDGSTGWRCFRSTGSSSAAWRTGSRRRRRR